MRVLAIFIACLSPLAAETLRCVGVLGNSGEQGDTLVRFAAKPASGMGVAYDPSGSLWDRAGDGRLNRYALDGRLVASYPLPAGGGSNDKDQIALSPSGLLMKIGKQLLYPAGECFSRHCAHATASRGQPPLAQPPRWLVCRGSRWGGLPG